MTVFTRNFLLQPALLLSLLPSIRGGRRRRRSRRGGGCCRWKPFSFRRFRRGKSGAFVRCAGGPWRLRRFARRIPSAPLRYGGRERRVPEDPAPHETFLACGLRCVGE